MIYLLTLYAIGVQAQKTHVWGKVMDERGHPLVNATVLLLQPADSCYISGTISREDGVFSIGKPAAAHYLIEVSMLGYRKEYRTLSPEHSGELATIRLQEDSYLLSGVTVTANKPYIEMESGKMTVNISSSLLGSTSDLVETLRNLPGVLVREDGSIVLNGQPGATVFIDNKPTWLSGEELINWLRSIPAATVEAVELLTSPPARYEASGVSGIINIRTKKSRIEGITVPVYTGYTQGKYGKGQVGLSFHLRKERLLFYSSYSYFKGSNFNDGEIERTTYDPLTEKLSDLWLLQSTYRKYNNQSYYYQIGMEYDLTDKTLLSLYNRGNFYRQTKKEEMRSSFHTGKAVPDSLLITESHNRKQQNTYAAGTMLSWRPYSGAEWSTSVDYQYFHFRETRYTESRGDHLSVLQAPELLRGELKGEIAMYSAESTLVLPLTENYQLEAGVKTTFIPIANDAVYQRSDTGLWIDDPGLSNGFAYKENIHAGYLQLRAGMGRKIKMEVGVRVENTGTRSLFTNYPEGGNAVVKQHYTHLFPSLRVNYRISDKNSIGIGYGKRIVRPNYRDLNPFIEVRDNFLYEQGNPELKPELVDNIDLTWNHKNRFAATIIFSATHHPITQSYLAIDEKSALITPYNLDHNRMVGVRLQAANLKPASFWGLNLTGNLYYKQYQWKIEEIRESNRQLSPVVDINNEFTFFTTWKAELTGMFYGKMVEGQAVLRPMWTVNGALQKSFLNHRASIRLYANDLFFSLRYRMSMKSPSLSGNYRERAENTHIGIVFNYRFSKGREAKNSARKTSIDESKRINL